MIDISIKQLEEKIRIALEDLQQQELPKLISITKEIKKHHPLHVFEGAKVLGEDRFYWVNTDRTLALTGVGSVKTITAIKDRFHDTEVQWKDILANAWIDNPYSHVPGTGVVSFGGMAFDPLKGTTVLWEKFKPSQFYIPELLLTMYEDGYYLTMNIIVHPESDIKRIADELQKKKRVFLSETEIDQQSLAIVNKKEVATEQWKSAVLKAMKEMQAKKAEKIVLAREVRLYFNRKANISQIIENLHVTQANSYIFAIESDGDCFVGATPERLVRVQQKDLLSTCLAGTAPRGKTPEEDRKIGQRLLYDEKNREEHEFVVKMIKEALIKTCTDVVMPKEPVLHPLKNLQHLYTPVTGRLLGQYSIFDVVKDLHPTPALGGTPTDESLAFIRENEALDRGWYGAPIGWVDSNDNGEFAVAIRSALIQGQEASLFAGCGVLADSDLELEYEETNIKFLPMLNVLGGNLE